MTSEIINKVIILVVGLILLFINTLFYIKRTKSIIKVEKEINKKEIKVENNAKSKTTKKSSKSNNIMKAAQKDEEVIIVKEQPKLKEDNTGLIPNVVATKKHSIWPFILIFAILFVVVILAFMPWIDAFGIQSFDKATEAVTKFELFEFPLFAKIFGTMNAFGYWSIIDLITLLFVVALILVIIYRVKFNDILEGALTGIRKTLPIGILVILLYTCLVITTYHPFQLEIYNAMLSGTEKLNVGSGLIISLSTMLSGIFNVEPAYAFQSILPYVSTIIADNTAYSIIAVIAQSMYGFAMLFAPTSLVLMIVLNYLDISYSKWLKNIWKLLLEFLLALIIIFIIIILI